MAWVAEEDFESYSVGDLTGGNGGSGWSGAWSGDTDFDVLTTDPYEGSKHMGATNPDGNMTRHLTTAVSSGVHYIAMKYPSGSSDAKMGYWVTFSTNYAFLLQFLGSDGTVKVYGSGTTTIISTFSNSLWYLFEITFNGDDTLDIRYHDGTSWSSSSTGLGYNSSGSIATLNANVGATVTIYFDYLSATDPLGGGGTGAVPTTFLLMGV